MLGCFVWLVLLCGVWLARADSQFTFDRSGNLLTQTPANLTLPQILAHPQPQVAEPGELASFFVVATDTRDLAYQWRTNGVDLTGANSDTLLLTNVSAASEGLYSVVLVNGSGSVTSAPAMLWIDTDGDGLADSWEQSYFGGLAQNPGSDFDGDGVSNFTEFDDGTSPTNSASVLFRLTVMSDGGQVAVSSAKLSYTNGEMVTLTATAYPPEIFHGWTGATISRTNPLTLVMNSNKTVFASFQPKILVWAGGASGDWHNPLNWSPNFVPTAVDEVTLSSVSGTISINEPGACRQLTINGGTLTFSGSGPLTVSNLNATGGTFTCNVDVSVQNLYLTSTLGGSGVVSISHTMGWPAGTMSGSGRTVIASNATLTINPGIEVALARTLENAGTTLCTGAGNLIIYGSVITNRPGALFHVQNAQNFSFGSNPPRFDNAGTFRKSVSSGTTTVGVPFNNYADMDIQTGTLVLNGNFLNNGTVTLAAGTTNRMLSGSGSGTFNAPATALIEWPGGTFTLNPGAQLNGPASYRINGGTVNCNADLAIHDLYLSSTLGGSGVVTISNTMDWPAGTMSGSGRTVIASNATLSINYILEHTLVRTLENAGTTTWTGTGNLTIYGSVITNCPGALFHVQNSQNFNFGSNPPRFDNAGTFRKSVSSGTTTVGVPFNNYADMDIQTGTLVLNGNFLNNGTVTLAAGTTQQMLSGSASGTFDAPATALVQWTGGTFTLNPGAHLNGAGTFRFNGVAINCNADMAVQNLDFFNGTLGGSGVVTISNAMTWSWGTMSGSGRTVIASNATLTIDNTLDSPLSRTLENAGTTLWTGTGGLVLYGGVITNRPGALFHVQNAAPVYFGSPTPRFDNAGTFRKSANSGTTPFNILFNNYGTTDIRSGILAASGGFNSSSTAQLNCTLGGTTAGSGYGQLQRSGSLTLGGALSVDFTNGFYPNTGNVFTVVSASSLAGAFSSFAYPSNLVTMQSSNTSSSVIAFVTAYTTNGPPIFAVNPPTNQVIYADRTTVQSVFAAGAVPVTYQWMRNGTNLLDGGRITGAQSAALVISNFAAVDAGTYQVTATNAEGSASSAASVVMRQAVPKLNAGGAGWTLQGTTLPTMNSNSVTLTSGLLNTSRSVFYNAPLYTPAFAASFIYRDVGGGGADGATFCLQNASNGAATLGGGGGGLGYFGITPSVALAMNIYSPNTVGIALRTNGTLPSPGGYSPTTPVNIASGNPIHVSLLYTGSVLRVTLTDLNTSSTFTTNYPVNFSAVLGAETAYVGFTGGDGGLASTQVVSNYTYVPLTPLAVEQPGAGSLVLTWPASIGGYTMQSKSNLASTLDPWQDITNNVVQSNNLNRVTITPKPGGDNHRLQINLNE
jgi:hypothetical protein